MPIDAKGLVNSAVGGYAVNNQSQIQWHVLAPTVLAVYNNKRKHRITGLTPADARKPSSEADAKIAMEIAASRGRRFPTLPVGDTVRILRKTKR